MGSPMSIRMLLGVSAATYAWYVDLARSDVNPDGDAPPIWAFGAILVSALLEFRIPQVERRSESRGRTAAFAF